MNTLAVTLRASLKRVLPSVALLSILALAAGSANLNAADAPASAKAAAPVSATFEKNAAATTEGPYVMTLKNTSDHAIKVSVHVDEDVTAHNRPKARDLGPKELAAGATWKIDNLAAGDKVTVSGDGIDTMKLTVK